MLAGLPDLGPSPPSTIHHNNPFQQVILDTTYPTVHQSRMVSAYVLAMVWNVDNVLWQATSSNTTVASVVYPNSLSEMGSISPGMAWLDNVTVNPHNSGTTTITVTVTDNRVHWTKSFDVTVTNNTHPAIRSIGPQYIDLNRDAHTITFSAKETDMDPLSWRYVFVNHTYFTINNPGDCEVRPPYRECDLPSNTLSVIPAVEGETILIYLVHDGRGGSDLDGVKVNVAPNTATVHGDISDVTVTNGESATVQFQATDADGDVIIHLTPRLNDYSIAEASIPYRTSNQEMLSARSTTPSPGYTAESVTYDNSTIVSISVLKDTPSGNKLRYVANSTGVLPAMPESVIITNQYERSPAPATSNLTMTITGLSVGNTTVYSTVRDVWGGYDTKNFTVTVLPAAPVITLAAPANMTIHVNSTYVEPGYNATDYKGTDITGNVTVTGTVDTRTIGTYTLYYDVTDSHGGAAVQQVRTVAVLPLPNRPPVADAGPDRTFQFGQTVTLDGSGSHDPDGDTLEHSWVLLVILGSIRDTVQLSDPAA